MSKQIEIKTPVIFTLSEPEQFGFAVFYDADLEPISPERIAEALNSHAALQKQTVADLPRYKPTIHIDLSIYDDANEAERLFYEENKHQ